MSDAWSRLWSEVFGEPPPLAGDTALLARILIENLPNAPPYQPCAMPRADAPAAPRPPHRPDEVEQGRASVAKTQPA